MVFKKFYCIFFLCVLLTACATYSPQYRDTDAKPIYPSEKIIEKTFYLVGDAGLSPMGGMSDGLTAFQNFLKKQTTDNNYTIFLGDNVYPAGMNPEGHADRKEDENMLDAQYKAVKDYNGIVYFIPGNHEWYSGGPPGVKREEDYIESKFNNPEVFKPANGCPLESISVSKDIQLLILDTQWFLEDWNRWPTINENCDIKTREKLFIEIALELEKNQNKTIVFAMHHPMFTNGNHGGYFALEKHLYPMQRKIPLPGLASLIVQVRSQGGVSVQDRYNELYNNLMTRLQSIAKNNKRIVFVSGHEHTIQYIEKNGMKQIVSGSGSKTSYASIGQDGLFSDGRQGFAVLDVFTDGSSWVRFFGSDEHLQPELVFQKEVIPAPKDIDISNYNKYFPQDTIAAIYKQDSINEALFFKTVWGAKYKKAYSQLVNAKIASLDTLYGGLRVLREGVQQDYRSLLLTDDKGNRYRMRAMGKNALKISQKINFEENLQNNEETEELQAPNTEAFDVNFYTASHPYAVLAIPDLARAANVFYTTPQLFYVPKQRSLGNYNDTFGDELYLFSVEPTENSEGEDIFKYPDDVETTDDILTKIRKNGDIFVDEENYIKSRLFDMLIGDWDREPDHWRWAEYYNRYGKNVYVPIPKSRDEAFSSFDGNILDFARSIFGGTRQSHVYDNDLRDLRWFNQEGIILDRAILQRSGRNQWTYLAKNIQDSITEAVIEKAFNSVPEEVRDEALEEIISKLKERKNNLVDIADRYYTFLSTLQTIVGTDFNDKFEITRLPDGKTNIMSFTTRDGKKTDTLINRTFTSADTKEIWIYGLGGKDTFQVIGEADNLIYIRIIGGEGEDVFNLPQGRRVKVYDYQSKPNTVEKKEGGTLRFTDVYTLNTYDYRKQIDRSQGIVSAIGYNPDDGFRVGLQYVYRVDNFQRNPFSQKHVINGAYFTDISSFEVSYSGEFANIKNDLNLSFGAHLTSPNYTYNFFGYGNESPNLEDELGYDFNRVEVQNISANVGLLRNSSFGSLFKLQSTFDVYKVNPSANNYVNTLNIAAPEKTNYFGTVEGIYSYRSADDPNNPTLGMLFDLNLGVTDNLADMDRVFGFLKSRIGFYNTLVTNRTLVLKTNIRTQLNFGDLYEFYQAASLGGNNGLRGFREERFNGRSLLVGSADLRYSFKSFKIGLIPLQIGIYGGADMGRVWIPGEDSKKWHNSRGGGLWINGSGGLNANFSAFNSKEGTRIVFGLGFDF